MTIRIGYWDCPSCGGKKNLGPNPICASCGRPRGANIPFYTDDSAPVVEDPEMVARARAGADWTCKYCSADNRAGVLDCQRCGAGPDGSVKRAESFVPVETPEARGLAGSKKKSGFGPMGCAAILGVLALLGMMVWALFFRTTALEATVESVAWVKSAQVEALTLKTAEAWEDRVPERARVVRTTTKLREKEVVDGTKKVKVGQKDLGNGMFEDVVEEQPNRVTKEVDDTWVRYEVESWSKGELLERRTTDGSEPPDPAAGFALGHGKRLGETKNVARYVIKATDGQEYEFEVDVDAEGAAAVRKYQVGKRYKAEVNALGGVHSLDPL